MLAALALAMTVARRELLAGSPLPPVLTATIISRAILVKIWDRLASAAPLVFWILCHLECPDISLVPFSEFIKKRWYYITSPCPLQPLDGDSLPHRGPGGKISGELTKYGIPFGLCVGAHIMRPPVLHRLSLFCQGRRDTTVGSARPLDPPTAAAQTGEAGVIPHPRRTPAPYPRPVSPASGVRGKADCGT